MLAEVAPHGHWYSEQRLPCLGVTVHLGQANTDTAVSEQAKRGDEAPLRHANEVLFTSGASASMQNLGGLRQKTS